MDRTTDQKINTVYADSSCRLSKQVCAYASVVAELNGAIVDMLDKKEYAEVLKDFTMQDVDLPVGKRRIIIAKSTDVTKQHNNYGELLALVAALRIALTSKIMQVCSDSELLIKWWSKGHCKSVKDSAKLAYIRECAGLRAEFEKLGGKIVQIPGSKNPADLGYHH